MNEFNDLTKFFNCFVDILNAVNFHSMHSKIIGADSIRETIAFPKNQQAKCLLTNAPSNVSESQLKELDIEITIDE